MADPAFDRNYIEIRSRIAKLEDETSMLMLDRELSVAASDLIAMPGWKAVCDSVASLGQRQIKRLKSEELTPYAQGRAQGFLRAMDTITRLRKLTPEEVALLEEKVSLCTEKIADLRNLLD